MRLGGRTIGSFNLLGCHSFLSDGELKLARGLADLASISIQQHQSLLDVSATNSLLSSAIQGRIVVEQAMGVICQSTNCKMQSAFDRLKAHAENHGESLTLIARRVTGMLIDPNLLDAVPPTPAQCNSGPIFADTIKNG
jgi:GAF domain-containing protein